MHVKIDDSRSLKIPFGERIRLPSAALIIIDPDEALFWCELHGPAALLSYLLHLDSKLGRTENAADVQNFIDDDTEW